MDARTAEGRRDREQFRDTGKGSRGGRLRSAVYDATVTCVTRLRARPDKADELRELLGGLVAPSLHGRGCLQFQILRGLGDRPEFLIVERWRSETQFRRNREAAHVASAL